MGFICIAKEYLVITKAYHHGEKYIFNRVSQTREQVVNSTCAWPRFLPQQRAVVLTFQKANSDASNPRTSIATPTEYSHRRAR